MVVNSFTVFNCIDSLQSDGIWTTLAASVRRFKTGYFKIHLIFSQYYVNILVQKQKKSV